MVVALCSRSRISNHGPLLFRLCQVGALYSDHHTSSPLRSTTSSWRLSFVNGCTKLFPSGVWQYMVLLKQLLSVTGSDEEFENASFLTIMAMSKSTTHERIWSICSYCEHLFRSARCSWYRQMRWTSLPSSHKYRLASLAVVVSVFLECYDWKHQQNQMVWEVERKIVV